MTQIHGETILSMEFKSIIKAHGLKIETMAIYLSKAQFTLAISKPNSHWQHQNSILIGDIKAQFSLTISKTQLTLALFIESPKLSILGKILYHNYFT